TTVGSYHDPECSVISRIAFGGGQRIGAIGPLMGDEIERLGHRDYARAHWYYIASQSGWIAAAIPALVVMAHKRRSGGQGWVPSNQVSSDVGVTSHECPLVLT